MKWKKKGMIFDLNSAQLVGKFEYAQSPQALVLENVVRIYFSTRTRDIGDASKFLSKIAFVDFDKSFKKILNISTSSVIELGELGCFDEHGIFPINILQHADKIYAYTCGWSRRQSVSVETSTGLAFSADNGLTFQKIGLGPVLTSSLYEPVLVGDSFVRFFENTFHMWYIFGQKWKEESWDEPPARIYKIAHATSTDGVNWTKEEGKQIITDVLASDECQALPTVIKIGNRYHMYFCFRQATDFRKNPKRGYRLGYAYSDDLFNWTRDDMNAGITNSENAWDSEMMCYPHVFESDGSIYLLYNGNEFGKHGFGIAELMIK